MKHARTTLLGIFTVISALSKGALEFMQTGTVSDLSELISMVTAGVGLILAADGK